MATNDRFDAAFQSQVSRVKRGKRIMVDFDGVIHSYDNGFQGGKIYGTVMPGALTSMHRLWKQGYEVVVFTTRGGDTELKKGVEEWLAHQFVAAGLGEFPIVVTHEKLPAIAYIDDRAIRFTNWEDVRKYFD